MTPGAHQLYARFVVALTLLFVGCDSSPKVQNFSRPTPTVETTTTLEAPTVAKIPVYAGDPQLGPTDAPVTRGMTTTKRSPSSSLPFVNRFPTLRPERTRA